MFSAAFVDILGSGHCVRSPLGNPGDAHSGLALASWSLYHSSLHLCHSVFCKYDSLEWLYGITALSNYMFIFGDGGCCNSGYRRVLDMMC